jgi:hypothetical protein
VRRTETSWFEEAVASTIICHLKTGESLKGNLAAVYTDALSLRDAVVLDPDTQTELKGTIAVPRDSIDYIQQVG